VSVGRPGDIVFSYESLTPPGAGGSAGSVYRKAVHRLRLAVHYQHFLRLGLENMWRQAMTLQKFNELQ
jgi:hypothetical protein